jgi:cobalt/nickel transport system permease protein
VLASISCAGQLALSKSAPWAIAFPAMANVHMLIGVGEGLATGLVVLAVLQARPELIASAQQQVRSERGGLIAYGFLIALGLALFVAPFACPWPDGLEMVVKTLGFAAKASHSTLPAPMADYRLPFIGSATLATGVAGVIGTVLAFVAAYGLARVLVPVLGEPKKDAPSGN